MGRLPTNNRIYEIVKIQDNHREILRRLTLGQLAVDIARDLGCTTSVVSYVRNSQLGKAELTSLQNGRDQSVTDLTQQIKDTAPEAFETLLELRRDMDTPRAIRARVAFDHLDRAGHGAIKKTMEFRVGMTPEQLADIKQRAKENRRLTRIDEAEVIEVAAAS